MSSNVKFWGLLVAALLVVVVILGGSGSEGPPLDPRSVSPDGARGLVETLESLGAEVRLDSAVPDPDATTAIILEDRLTVDDRDLVRAWVRRGGVLVVADWSSALLADRLGFTQGDESGIIREQCTIGALDGVERLPVGGRLFAASNHDFCFGNPNLAFVVAQSLGDGTIVSVGNPEIFTNQNLDEDDAAVLALALLAPNRDQSTVTFIGPSVLDFGEEGLNDLVAPRVRNAIFQLLAAFLFYALYRSRRLGSVVKEPLPVHIEGSELVLKAGLLSERAKDPASAALLLQADVINRARRALSVDTEAGTELLSQRIATRTGLAPAEVSHALTSPVVSEEELSNIMRTLSDIDRLLYDSAPTGGSTP